MILTIGNVKGGVGKTTLAVNLAIAFARARGDVLLIDGDEQGTALAFTDLRTAEKGNLAIQQSRCMGRVSVHRSANSPPNIRISSLMWEGAIPAV